MQYVDKRSRVVSWGWLGIRISTDMQARPLACAVAGTVPLVRIATQRNNLGVWGITVHSDSPNPEHCHNDNLGVQDITCLRVVAWPHAGHGGHGRCSCGLRGSVRGGGGGLGRGRHRELRRAPIVLGLWVQVVWLCVLGLTGGGGGDLAPA